MVDDALGEEVRVTVVAAGFDKVTPSAGRPRTSSSRRLSRLLEEPVRGEGEREPLPSILADEDDDDIFTTGEPEPKTVSFDAEEDLDIPDFLKS